MNESTIPPPNNDYTVKDRQRRRREKLDRAAKRLGFSSWSVYETHVINNETDWFAEIDELTKPESE